MKIYLDKWYMVTFNDNGFMAMQGSSLVKKIEQQRECGYKLQTDIKHISSVLPDGYITR